MNQKSIALFNAAVRVLNAESPITLRGLLYRLVSSGHLQDTTAKSYNRLKRLMGKGREDGSIPMSMIVDNLRETVKPSSWTGLNEFGETVREAYRKDFWASLDCHIAIFCEKDAIAGTLQKKTREYDVPLHPCRGYASISFAGMIAEEWQKIEKPIHAYYLGDYDASGFDIERDLKEKLARYSQRHCFDVTDYPQDGTGYDEDDFTWRRLGINESDFAKFDLIELAVKKTDKRAAQFIRQHGARCAEVDAIPPSELRSRIEDAILQHVDTERWAKLQETEELEKETVRKTFINLGAA